MHQIADKIESGAVILRQGQEELTLAIPTNLILEVQVEDEDKRRKAFNTALKLSLNGLMMRGRGGPLELG
ncbi:MAG: amphi-Trp domain-containing protein [Chloroflexi bacterium]|nr:amphi-Trp domain-containing protein [Chloroflexota bacterium]